MFIQETSAQKAKPVSNKLVDEPSDKFPLSQNHICTLLNIFELDDTYYLIIIIDSLWLKG